MCIRDSHITAGAERRKQAEGDPMTPQGHFQIGLGLIETVMFFFKHWDLGGR